MILLKKDRICRLTILKDQRVLSDKCYVAERFFSRLRGLIGLKGLVKGESMYFPDTKSIHLWMMKFEIDVIFVKQKSGTQNSKILVVTSLYEKARPWKLTPLLDLKASGALECQAGTIQSHYLNVGDEICID